MRTKVQWASRVIDVVCGCAVAACLAGFLWFTLVRENTAKADVERLSRLMNRAQQERRTLETSTLEQRTALAGYREDLAETGQLPTETPVEAYFQALSSTALKHGLRIVRHNPLSSRRYPGLLEQRYAYEVSGPLPDVVAFLKSIEESDFWADVSYLKIDQGKRRSGMTSSKPNAALTVSLFSALPADMSADEGGA